MSQDHTITVTLSGGRAVGKTQLMSRIARMLEAEGDVFEIDRPLRVVLSPSALLDYGREVTGEQRVSVRVLFKEEATSDTVPERAPVNRLKAIQDLKAA